MHPLEDTIISVDKPYGWTSFDVVNLIKNRFRLKVGHAGTLDPLATGLLLVCSGKKTKSIDQLQAMPKEYEGVICLGAFRPSFDKETPVTQYADPTKITDAEIHAAAKAMIGKQEQVAPLFSAKKVNGQPVYLLAREGKEMELKANTIEILSFEVLEISPRNLLPDEEKGIKIAQFKAKATSAETAEEGAIQNDAQALIDVRFRIRCSKGTYIRSIARDIALTLGTVGHLSELVRTRIGDYSLDEALSCDQLKVIAVS
jgi:tRNA pseudouridine55 synthase